MNTKLDYDNACNWQEMLDFIDDNNVPTTSLQTPKMNPVRHQPSQMNLRRQQPSKGNPMQPQR